MLLASALLVIASVVTFALLWTEAIASTDPKWIDAAAYASIAGFCIGCFGVFWALGMWIWEVAL